MTPEGERELLRLLTRIRRDLTTISIIACGVVGVVVYELVRRELNSPWGSEWAGVAGVIVARALSVYIGVASDRD